MTEIVLVNQTGVLTDADVAKVIPVLQTLFDRDFEPVWGTGLALHISAVAGGAMVRQGSWPIFLLDTTDQPGAGGYHLDDTGTPYGKVFCKDAMDAGESWTVDLTHEFLEMASDPTTDTLIDLPGMLGFSCLREVGDAVEEDTLGYTINGVLVTDWCAPEYFYQARVAGYSGPCGQYDFMGHINAPAPALLHGGYLGIRNPDGLWGQVSMFKENGQQSRRAMRRFGRLSRMAHNTPVAKG